MNKFIKNNILTLTGAILGAIGGYLYWHSVGCSSGSCAITSKPLNSTLYGAAMGGLLFSSFEEMLKNKKNKTTGTTGVE
ncbi:MAG TPA: DUF6132 family protein [Saprospiraceae bacterium]|nr:hypothetical protein [Saprospiraceae bacterium]MCC6688732.1 hypothetical protein [Saprospiraceae bacterium]HMV24607.1 DUF6132 family protein [Saprospiraceae bacterium]HMW74474.1 DUF6132 family protein [Saprospiraceae bacterium]HMX83442.1 DUF6132 family protein [Saprospiraceae bacterium]